MKLVITEQQYKLILEADKRQAIVNNIGFSQEWADAFHSISDKLSVWIANKTLEHYVNNPNADLDRKPEGMSVRDFMIQELNQMTPNNPDWYDELAPDFRFIMDWVRGSNGRANVTNMTLDQAREGAQQWHDSLEVKIQTNYDETGEVFIDYRDRRGIGFYWVNLHRGYCSDEQQRMGHCGRASQGELISLRAFDEEGNSESFVTVDYDRGVCYDFHSRANTKPPARYHRYIMDFLVNSTYPVNKLSKRAHKYEENFHMADLTQEQQDWVYQRNGTLKYDIEDESSWPRIIDAILRGELDINTYSFTVRIALVGKSNYNQELIDKLNLDNQSIVRIFIGEDDALPSGKFKQIFMNTFGSRLVEILSSPEGFDQAVPTIETFKKILRLISMEYIDSYETFCPFIDYGFRKWEDFAPDIISTPRLKKKILRCTDVVDILNHYTDFQPFDELGHALVRIDDDSKLWGLIDRQNNFVIEPDYEALNYSPMAKNKQVFIGRKPGNQFFMIDLEKNEIKNLANR